MKIKLQTSKFKLQNEAGGPCRDRNVVWVWARWVRWQWAALGAVDRALWVVAGVCELYLIVLWVARG